MPAPPIVDDALFADFVSLPPPPPLLPSSRQSRSAPRYYHSFAPSVSYCELTEPTATGIADSSSEVILLTSPAATYKEKGREISGLCRVFSRTSIDSLPPRQKRSGTNPLPRHPPLLPSKSSPALHRSPSKSPPPLPAHLEESSDVGLQCEDKQYSPCDCSTLLSSSIQSTSVSALASSPFESPPPSLCSSDCAVLTSSSHRSLSAHVNPFRTQIAHHRTLPATGTVGSYRRRVTDSHKVHVDGRTASTASTCSMASSSLSYLTSPSRTHAHTLFFNPDSSDNDADLDCDSDGSEEGEDDDTRRQRNIRSQSQASHFTFTTTLSLQSSASFSFSSSSSSLCSSPPSPLFDTSMSNGRHSADAQFSAGIGVFAGQLQTLRRMRSAHANSSPSVNSPANNHSRSLDQSPH